MRYGKPIKNKKRIDPRYFINEEQEVATYVIEKSGRGAEDMYLKKGSHTDKPLWGGMDDAKRFTGEVPGEAKLSAEVFIKQAGEAGVNVDGWRVEKS